MSEIPDQTTGQLMSRGIAAARANDFATALTLLGEVYNRGGEIRAPEGLSFYGLSLAMVGRKYKAAVDFCRLALDKQFYNADHYVNLAKVYLEAGSRKKAVEVIDEGFRMLPHDPQLTAMRRDMGVRGKPPISFLSRDHPLNVALGRARHARKAAAAALKRKPSSKSSPKKKK